MALPAGVSLLVDTSVVLAYLTGTESDESAGDPALRFLHREPARNPAALSTVTVQEIARAAHFEARFGRRRHRRGLPPSFREIRVVDVSYESPAQARHPLRDGPGTPDALIVATAVVTAADVIVTDDRSWGAPIQAAGRGLRVRRLGD